LHLCITVVQDENIGDGGVAMRGSMEEVKAYSSRI
jgi:hypothetical protein